MIILKGSPNRETNRRNNLIEAQFALKFTDLSSKLILEDTLPVQNFFEAAFSLTLVNVHIRYTSFQIIFSLCKLGDLCIFSIVKIPYYTK